MAQDQSRFRIVLSDINNYVQGMLAQQATHFGGTIKTGSFVRLKQFTANAIKGKRILIVIDLDVLDNYPAVPKLGNPAALTAEGAGGQQQGAPKSMSGAGFYGQVKKEDPSQAPKQSLPSRSANSSMHGNIMPVEALSPYANKWTIKARVTNKSEVRTWHNKNGEGKLFSVNLLDESGEIKATAFNDQCDAFYDVFQQDSVYYISQGDVKPARKQFSTLNNDYEISLSNSTIVEKAEDQSDVPKVMYNFTQIADIASVEKDAVVDVIGVLKEIGETSEITSKTTFKTFSKRELTLVDNTQFSIRLTVWGSQATAFDAPLDSVIAFKGVKVSDFGGRSLSLLSSGTMGVDPDVDEAHRLKGWYDATGKNDEFNNHESMRAQMGTGTTGRNDQEKTIQQVKDERLGLNSDEAEYFQTKATIIFIKQDNISYPACPSPPEQKCNKKVTEEPDGSWRCEQCNKTYPKPEYRYIMSMNVADHTGQMWLSCFDDTGRMVIGMSADEFKDLGESGIPQAAQSVLTDATWKTLTFRCRAKMDTYQDQSR